LGSGLTANGKNLFNASGLYLAFNNFPVLLDQRFAIDPCRPSLRASRFERVILLESRTPHQPGKLQKLSKNEVVFTPSTFRVKQKRAILSALKSIECSSSTGQ
jgi:hypothetical protein